jgi:hypothetical protein
MEHQALNAYKDIKGSSNRLHCPAEAWALVALPEVQVTVRAIDSADLQRLNLASILDAAAAA